MLENNYNRNGKGKFFQILLQWRTKMKTTNQQPTTVGTSPKWKQPMISTGCVLLASLLMSVNIKSFVRAGNLIPGGFTGLSLLLQRTAETFFGISLPYSVINIALNAIPAIIGFRMIGKKFTSYTVLMIVLNSFLVDLIPVTPITYDPLLVSVFGGILNGTAISIALFGKASSGGTDVIAMLLKKYTNMKDIGIALFATDLIMILVACFVFDLKTALYSFVGLAVKSFMIDDIITTINLRKSITIVCDDKEPICSFITAKLNRSATITEGVGAYTNGKKYIIFTSLSRTQAVELRNFIHDQDLQAFMSVSSTSEVFGKGFHSL